MNNGFIKLFRCIEDSFFWNDSQAVHLWIQLLLSANHRDKEMLLFGEKVIIKSGQFVCSRLTLSTKTGINESKIQRILKVFESEQMIEQQMNSKYRMISISNWNKYQGSEQVNEQQMNSKRTADEQQMNTNNNNKNEENKEKDTIVSKKKAYSESFETFWKAYCRPKDKGSKPDAYREWQKLTESEQQKAIESIIPYKNSQSSPEYMKHAERYLKTKAWEGINAEEEKEPQPFFNYETGQREYK